MEIQRYPISFKVPTYVPTKRESYVAPKREELALSVVDLLFKGIDLALTAPEKAKTFAKVCLAVGGIGVTVWALTELLK